MAQTSNNYLIGNSWQLQIPKFKDVAFMTNSCNLPKISGKSIEVGTRFSPLKVSGTKLEFEQLEVEFIIDPAMKNYLTMYQYLVGLNPLQSLDKDGTTGVSDYQSFIGQTSSLDNDFQDISLIIYDNYNQPLISAVFHDAYPTSLSLPTSLAASKATSSPLVASATFDYTWFDFR